ncbi:MAG TPA: DoxX family protein [Cyclobacteriaceae bacterium]|nr:DoxX family protein [Cyclobacteriaceae bacterium]
MKRVRFVLFWLIGLTFITTGILKYIDLDEMSKAIFDRANYPKWFFYVVGSVELVGGVLLLMTASASKKLGSILISLVMLGAIGTHYILKDSYTHFVVPGIILLLAFFSLLDVERRGK